MAIRSRLLNRTVASLLAIGVFCAPALALDEAKLDTLYGELSGAEPAEARRVAKEIELEWSKSGSPSIDLLLKRGTDALEAGEVDEAIEHFTALTDHAPDFAEGWHRRSLAFLEAEMYGPAVADIERTLALMPRHYDAIATLGGLLLKIDKPEAAKQAFEQVLAIHPHHAEVTAALDYVNSQISGKDL
ncbi:MAG: hypothetical protein RIG84_08960 [Roseovarius sp.]